MPLSQSHPILSQASTSSDTTISPVNCILYPSFPISDKFGSLLLGRKEGLRKLLDNEDITTRTLVVLVYHEFDGRFERAIVFRSCARSRVGSEVDLVDQGSFWFGMLYLLLCRYKDTGCCWVSHCCHCSFHSFTSPKSRLNQETKCRANHTSNACIILFSKQNQVRPATSNFTIWLAFGLSCNLPYR
jgi:hypothetical protein